MPKDSDPSVSSAGLGDEVTAQVLCDMLEQSEVATLIVDPDLRLMWANCAAESLLGGREEHLRRDLRQILTGLVGLFVDREAFLDAVLASYAEGRYLEKIGVRTSAGDGTERWWEYSSQPIRNGPYEGGRIESFFDVTQQRADEHRFDEQLRQAQKMEAIGRLAGGIAHDFNNLLTAINGYSQLLARMITDESQRNYVEEIRKAGKRAAEMTANLLRVSRRQVINPQVVGVERLVHDIEGLLQKMIGEDVTLLTRIAPGTGSIQVDPGQMEQVLLNMAVNARDAMPTGGDLVIAAKNVDFARRRRDIPPDSYVCLEVSDTGVGIEPEIAERIFEPLFTTKEKGKGTGFGLATAYATVTLADGYIQVDSTPGEGTTFRIFLPRAGEATRRPPTGEFAALPPQHGDERILLVEDDEGVRTLVKELLEQQGYTLLVAKNAREALKIVEGDEEPIDLLVTDVVMPSMSGPDLAKRLMPAYPEMRILFISGYTDSFISQHGLEPTSQVVLQKPFDAHLLAEKVREVLDKAVDEK